MMATKSLEHNKEAEKIAKSEKNNSPNTLLDKIRQRKGYIFASIMAILAATGFGCKDCAQCHESGKESYVGCDGGKVVWGTRDKEKKEDF